MSPWLSDLFLRSQSDERLVALARAGHERAFAMIVERYRPELLALARRLNSDGRAEDVLQQAFLSAFTAIRSGTEVRHVRGWLYQIVRHAATRARNPVEVPLDDVALATEPVEDAVERRATAMSAVAELARLPERQRDALLAVALGGHRGADVAGSMGLSEGALRQLVHRARTTLRSAITVVTPWPLARWLAPMSPTPGGAADLAAATGVISTGAVAVKVGAVLATGLVATTLALDPGSHGHASSGGSKGVHVKHAHVSQAGRTTAHRAGAAASVLVVSRRVGTRVAGSGSDGDLDRSRSVASGLALTARPAAPRVDARSGGSGRSESGGPGDGSAGTGTRREDGGASSGGRGSGRHGDGGGTSSSGTGSGSGSTTSSGGGGSSDGDGSSTGASQDQAGVDSGTSGSGGDAVVLSSSGSGDSGGGSGSGGGGGGSSSGPGPSGDGGSGPGSGGHSSDDRPSGET